MFYSSHKSNDGSRLYLPDKNLKTPYPTAVGMKTPIIEDKQTVAIPNNRAAILPYLSEMYPNARDPKNMPTINIDAYIYKW